MNSFKSLLAILVSFQCLFLFSLAETRVSLNSRGQFNLPSSDIVEFNIDNSSNEKVVSFDLSIDINNSHDLQQAHFLLLISGTRIPPYNLIPSIVLGDQYYISKYNIFMIDTDGLSLGSKKLSVFYSSTSSNNIFKQLFVYALGPLQFGDTKLTYTGSRAETYLSSYSVTTQRTCLDNCNKHGDCIKYSENLSYCQCFSNYIGSYCSVLTRALVLDTNSSDYYSNTSLWTGDKLYLKIDFSDKRNQKLDNFYLNIKVTSPMMMFSVYVEKKGKNDLTPDYKHWIYKLGNNQGTSIDQKTSYIYFSFQKIRDFIDGQGSLVVLFTEATGNNILVFYGLSLEKKQRDIDNSDNEDSSKDKESVNSHVALTVILSITGVGTALICIYLYVRKYILPLRRNNQVVDEQQINNEGNYHEQRSQNQQENLRRKSNNVRLPPVQTYEQLVNKVMPAQIFNPRLFNNCKKQKKDENSFQCSICFEQFSPISKKVRKTICNHIFHDHCLMEWLTVSKQNCPLCRRPLTNASLLQFQINPHSYQDVDSIPVFPYSS